MQQKQQVVVIHGGTSFEKYEDYLSYLRTKKIDLDRLKTNHGWKNNLEADLGEGFEVLLPYMPNRSNARYAEWKIWFERIAEVLQPEVILVGHSLGGVFLAKYFAENNFNKKVRALFLVAAPYGSAADLSEQSDFALPKSLNSLGDQIQNVVIMQSNDDEVVPPSEAARYKKSLPKAELQLFDDKGHFSQEHFPELVQKLKKLATVRV